MFTPHQQSVPVMTVELSVECRDLSDRDLMSRSDPVCVLFTRTVSGWRELGRTERITDTLSPRWINKFVIDYKFEERQMLRFAVYDLDSDSACLDDHDFLGQVELSLAEVVSAQSRGFSRTLSSGGSIHILSEEVSTNKDQVMLRFSANNLDNKDFFGKSDPYLEISKSTESGQYSVVHRTEVINNNLNPQWRQFSLPVSSLCHGDYNRDIKMTVYDHDSDGDHDLIGQCHTTLNKLLQGPGSVNTYDCINQKKQRKKGAKYRNSGTVSLQTIIVERIPSFLDYIHSGTQVNFTLAVDFTGSNGHPSDPSSLHYRDPSGRPNQYQTAITAVAEIIQDYDSDKQFPCLGFGARLPPDGRVSHEFFLTLDPQNPFCAGLDGIMSAYYNSLNSVQLYGPTNFSPVIRHVAQFARAYQHDPTNYFVLLIITDGIITDIDETKKAIIESSKLPLSIIIVGVGDEEFDAMEELDSDDSLLRHGSLVAARDIVQFVELRKFVQRSGVWSKEHLAKEVLAEIPGQMMSYMKSKGFTPPTVSTKPTQPFLGNAATAPKCY